MKNSQKISTWKLAFSGIVSAFVIIIHLLGAVFPGFRYISAAAGSILIGIVGIECGSGDAFMTYLTSGILALFLVPEKAGVILFIIVFGYYPIVQKYFNIIKNVVGRVAIKLLYGNFILFILVRFFFKLYFDKIDFLSGYVPKTELLFLIIIYINLLYLIWDYTLNKFIKIYKKRIRPIVKRKSD